MEFQVLGHLAVGTDGVELPLGGPQQRLVLARLIVADGEVVSADRLIDDIWGDDPPATARKTVQGYVHHLRTQVGDRLATVRTGYLLRTDRVVDAVRFVDAHDAARAERDPSRSRRLLVEALAMWRGPAYADLREFTCLAGEIGQLEDRRLAAIGDRIEADLSLGRHRLVVGELDVLTAEHPLDEGLRRRHMLALYGAGRHVEALRSYERYRRHVRDELGLDPSEELRRLEHRILNHDVELDVAGVETGPALTSAPAGIRGYELRELLASTDRSETYRAYQRGIGRGVVVRIVDAQVADDAAFIAEFARSAQQVAALEHPNVRDVLDSWREPGAAYLVSRWLDGGSLHDAIEGRRASWPDVLETLRAVGDVLTTAHDRGVVHGRVHARNVLFDANGHPYLADFAIPAASGDSPERDRHDFARLARHAYRATVVGDPDPGVLGLLERACRDAAEHPSIDELLAGLGAASTAHAADRAAGIRNPYKGLHAFEEVDAADFFGRDDLVDRMVDRLETHRLIAVVGPSGSGKSSAVRAGLIPRLRARGDGTTLVASMYPGGDPFDELAGALRSVGRDDDQLLARLISGPSGLRDALTSVLPPGHDELVLVVDQLEELFSVVDDAHTRSLFLDSIVDAICAGDVRVRVVVTLRADFFDRPLQHPAFGRLLERGLVPVTSLSAEQLMAAIVEPAEAVGVTFEGGLPDLIVGDVLDQPGGLPLLQYTLTELFERHTQGVVTFAAYVEIGGVSGAVGRRAEQVHETLTTAGRRAVQTALLRLVTVDDDARDLRRRVALRELVSGSPDPAELDEAITAFAAERLLTVDRDPLTRRATVEVAHEALLREWPRLRGWIEARRDDLVTRRRVHAALADWIASRRDDSYLPTGGRLEELCRWADSTPAPLTADERDFVDAARRAAEAADAQQRARREREIRDNRRLRVLVRAVVAVAIVAVIAGAVAMVQRARAARSADAAERAQMAEESRRLVAEAPALVGTDRRVALMIAAEAYDRDPSPDTLGALQSVLFGLAGFHTYLGAGRTHHAVAWLDARTVVAADETGVTAYDVETGAVVASAAMGAIDMVRADRDGRRVAVVRGGTTTLLDDRLDETGEELVVPAQVTAIEFGPRGVAAIGDRDGGLHLWDPSTGGTRWLVSAHPERSMDEFDVDEFDSGFAHQPETFRIGTREISFSEDGRSLTTSGLAVVRTWDVATGAMTHEFLATRDVDGDRVLSAPLAVQGGDDAITVALGWSIATFTPDGDVIAERRVGRTLPGIDDDAGLVSEVLLVADTVVIGSSGGTLHAEPVADDGPVLELDAQLAGRPQLAVDPEGHRVAFAARDGIAIMALDGSGPVSQVVDVGVSGEATISSDGELLVVSSVDRLPAEFYDLSSSPPRRLRTGRAREPDFGFVLHGDRVLAYEETDGLMIMDRDLDVTATVDVSTVVTPMISRDGRWLALDSLDWPLGEIHVFDAATGSPVAVLGDLAALDGGGFVRSMDFSADGTRFVATDAAGAAVLWDTTTWRPTTLADGGGVVVQAKFVPDGSRIVTLTEDGDINVRDADTLQPLRVLVGNTDATAGLSHGPFFVDDRYMVTTADGNGRLWDLERGAAIGDPIPSDPGSSPNASMNGRWLVTFDAGRAVVWTIDIAGWPELACRLAGRGMTPDEWATYGPDGEPGTDVCSRLHDTDPTAITPTDDRGGSHDT